MLEFYFPAPLLMQYTGAISTTELRDLAEKDPVKLYLDFIRNTENDVHTTVLLPPNLRKRFFEYRNALYGLVLGKDVKLFFSKEAPEIPEWTPSDLEFYSVDVEDLKHLKLRRYRVIERIIITDLLFRLYYDLYPKLKDILKKYRKVDKIVKNFTIRKSSRYAMIEKDYVPFDRHYGSTVVNIHYPEQLNGFKAICFPLLSWSGVVQLGMLYFFASGRWEVVSEAVSELKQYEINGRIIRPKLITEPTEEFLQDCRDHYEHQVDKYIGVLERFINEVRSIVDERDPVEMFILSCLPATFFDIYEKARSQGYDPDEVVSKLKSLIRRGKVKVVGDMLK